MHPCKLALVRHGDAHDKEALFGISDWRPRKKYHRLLLVCGDKPLSLFVAWSAPCLKSLISPLGLEYLIKGLLNNV